MILSLLAIYLKRERKIPGGLARSVATTHLIDAIARKLDVELHETPVGFKYIGEYIKEGRIILGGEESAGLSIRGHVPEKDGILACLLIADELDTHAMNYKLLAHLRRTPKRPVAQTPNFLSSSEWEAHKLDLARLTAVPNETWQGLFNAYHNAQQLKSRIEIDGPEAPFPSHRIDDLRTHEAAATELASVLADAAERLRRVLIPGRRRMLPRQRPFGHASGTAASKTQDADERT